MKSNKIIIAIVPARKNSKVVKNKNILKLKKKPLINYTIDKAINCKKINKIIVTSDSNKILNIARDHKKIIKMLRPKKLATNASLIDKTIDYTLKKLKSEKKVIPNIILLLEPTSPLRKIGTINKAIKLLNKNKINSIIPVSKSKSIFGKIKNDVFQSLRKFSTNRHKRSNYYVVNSSIWGCKYDYFIKNKKILSTKPYPILVEFPENLDLNEKNDLEMIKKYI